MANNRKIKSYIIDPNTQLRLISYFVGLFVISTLSLYSVIFIFFWKFKNKALSVGIPDGHIFYTFLDSLKVDLDITFIFFSIFNLILLLIVGVSISHKIAGPIYRIKSFLSAENIKSQKFTLRKNDFFKDIEPIMEKLQEKIK